MVEAALNGSDLLRRLVGKRVGKMSPYQLGAVAYHMVGEEIEEV